MDHRRRANHARCVRGRRPGGRAARHYAGPPPGIQPQPFWRGTFHPPPIGARANTESSKKPPFWRFCTLSGAHGPAGRALPPGAGPPWTLTQSPIEKSRRPPPPMAPQARKVRSRAPAGPPCAHVALFSAYAFWPRTYASVPRRRCRAPPPDPEPSETIKGAPRGAARAIPTQHPPAYTPAIHTSLFTPRAHPGV